MFVDSNQIFRLPLQPSLTINLPSEHNSVQWVLENIKKPSILPYNLTHPNQADYSQNGQVPHMLSKYLKGRKNGKFLEVSIEKRLCKSRFRLVVAMAKRSRPH